MKHKIKNLFYKGMGFLAFAFGLGFVSYEINFGWILVLMGITAALTDWSDF